MTPSPAVGFWSANCGNSLYALALLVAAACHCDGDPEDADDVAVSCVVRAPDSGYAVAWRGARFWWDWR